MNEQQASFFTQQMYMRVLELYSDPKVKATTKFICEFERTLSSIKNRASLPIREFDRNLFLPKVLKA